MKRPQHVAWLVTGPLIALAFVLTLPVVLGAADVADVVGSIPLAVVFLAFFVLGDGTMLRFEVRRHAVAVSLSDVPLLLALVYLPPLPVLVVRLLAGAVIQTARQTGWTKAAFNLAALGAGTACANLIVFRFGPVDDTSPRTWAVLAAAVLVNAVVTLAAVSGVIALVQGWVPSQVARSAVPAIVVGCVNTMIGLVMLLTIHQSPWAVLLMAGLAVALAVVYRAYAQFIRQHNALAELYDLTRAINEASQHGTPTDVLLTRARALHQAESATLWLPAHGRHPEVLLSARVDYPGLLDTAGTPEHLRQQVLAEGETIAVGHKLGTDELRAALLDHGVADAIVVPLRSGSAVVGTLEVAGRLGTATFNRDDVRLLETLAVHAAVAMENARLVDQLRFDATHDSLTGLPNRRRMLAALDEAVTIRAPGEVVAVLLFDVADLRDVNDSLGHGAGDKVLAEVARRLRAIATSGALVGRVGGDEFALTVRTASAESAVALAEKIRGELQDPMTLDTLTVGVDCAVGVAVHPDHGADAASLLQRADVATHAAKGTGSSVRLFHPSLEARSVRRLGLAGDLRQALDRGELLVFFQPKVGLADRRLVGVECLARWDHPVYGSVAPEDFVAVAEHTGQICRLTDFVLREALRRARAWADEGRSLPVAVNLSPRTLFAPEFPGHVADLLVEYQVAPGNLTLEFAEIGVVGGPDRPLPNLHQIHDLGVRLSVDDFGSGYSSLAYLRRLPVDEVKVDRVFVQGMATDRGDLAIVRAIVDLARHFGLSVVAEGVESEITLGLLDEVGCDVGQGYLFSRPLPYERLDAWFAAQTAEETPSAGEVRWLRAVQ